MEYKSLVYNAARDGKLKKLKVFLDHRPKDEVRLVVSQVTNGSTPLLIAARNGHFDVCEYLIEKCTADIEQVGCVSFDGETIEGAPPLWCAAAAGHNQIVTSLLAHGANVNSTTKTHSTPLRAACFDGHLDIVKLLVKHGADIEIANRHGHTCLMIACYKGHLKIAKFLIEQGADVNRKSIKGNTALHDCAESGSLEIMKLLLDNGAQMNIDSYGMTPLNSASLSGHTSIVELITSLPTCSLQECIDALDLLGATFVDKKRDMLGALEFWRKAICLKQSCLASQRLTATTTPLEAYDYCMEAKTFDDLEELVSDPDRMRMQALLVRERILGPSHPDTSYYIRYRGAVYADTGNFDRCIRLWTYALDMQQKMLNPLSAMTLSSLLSFVELFSYMMIKSVNSVRFADIFDILKRSVAELESALVGNRMNQLNQVDQESGNLHRILMIVLHFIGLMCNLLPMLNASQENIFKNLVYRMVRLNPRGKNASSLVHLVCSGQLESFIRFPICEFSLLNVLELLLEVGASPNVVDDNLNTPLHLAASLKSNDNAFFYALLEHGAHLDVKNSSGEMPLQIASKNSVKLNVNPLKHCTLQCLCARIIVQKGIQFKGVVHQQLAEFIQIH